MLHITSTQSAGVYTLNMYQATTGAGDGEEDEGGLVEAKS
jgi:hypothetical protein